MRRSRALPFGARGSALVTAIFALALAGAVAALLADLARTTITRARVDRDGVRAWFLAEAGLTDTVAALPPGTTFTDALARTGGGAAPLLPGTYRADLRDDADDHPDDPRTDVNARILAQVTAAGPDPVRRRLEAIIGREPAPFLPGAATLAGSVSNLTGDFRLDGHDWSEDTDCMLSGHGLARAGVALPTVATMPLLADPAQVDGTGGAPSVTRRNAPDLTPLGASTTAVRLASSPLPATLGTVGAPQLSVVDGDAVVDGTIDGAGVLFVAGHLRIGGRLAFSGIVAAAGGIEVTAAGELRVCGALWAAGEPALDLRGYGQVRTSSDAIAAAARVAPLPARARVVAVRELF